MLKISSYFFVTALLLPLAGCSSTSRSLPASAYTIEKETDEFGFINIYVVPNQIIVNDSSTRKQLRRIWHREAKLACHGSYAGDPIESVTHDSNTGPIDTIQRENSKTKQTEPSVTVLKIGGTAFCSKISK